MDCSQAPWIIINRIRGNRKRKAPCNSSHRRRRNLDVWFQFRSHFQCHHWAVAFDGSHFVTFFSTSSTSNFFLMVQHSFVVSVCSSFVAGGPNLTSWHCSSCTLWCAHSSVFNFSYRSSSFLASLPSRSASLNPLLRIHSNSPDTKNVDAFNYLRFMAILNLILLDHCYIPFWVDLIPY